MRTLQELVEEAGAAHGHLCVGQVLGVRMAMLGCRELGIEDPRRHRGLLVFVETDRCAADAIQTVTGCSLGRRSLKHVDYGKMAATFVDSSSGQAVRVAALAGLREKAAASHSRASGKEGQTADYMNLPDSELFVVRRVRVELPPEDQPGSAKSRVVCERCGEEVSDRREVREEGVVLCRSCAYGAYYEVVD